MYSILCHANFFFFNSFCNKKKCDYKEAFSEALVMVMACCLAVSNLVIELFCCPLTLLLHMTRYVWRCIKSANTLQFYIVLFPLQPFAIV